MGTEDLYAASAASVEDRCLFSFLFNSYHRHGGSFETTHTALRIFVQRIQNGIFYILKLYVTRFLCVQLNGCLLLYERFGDIFAHFGIGRWR